MLERGKMDRNVIEMVEIDSLVPEGHLLRKIAFVQRGQRPAERRPGGAVQNGTDPASVWTAIPSADSGGGKLKYSLPLVFGVHLAGGNTALFHSEL